MYAVTFRKGAIYMSIQQIDLMVPSQTLVDKITSILKKRILSGELTPKTKLSELSVAGEFEVSRVPVREALQRLEEMGFVRRTRLGREVIEFSIEEYREIYEIKNIVEACGAMKGSQLATDADIEELQSYLTRMKECMEPFDLDEMRKWNARFHDRMVHCSSHRKIIEIYQLKVLQVRWASPLSLGFQDRPKRSIQEHRGIFEAFAQRDGQKTRMLMEKHTEGSMERIISKLEADRAGKSEDSGGNLLRDEEYGS